MKDFLLNEDFSMLQILSDNLIPQTTGVFMSRTIKMAFNVEQRAFELGYLNYEVDKSVRNSLVHCYYLSIDTRLSQFIEFLATISPEQERNSKINNIRQITLKVTYARRGQVFYNLTIKGDTTGIITFKPSELKDYQGEIETDVSSLERLIDFIIHEEEEEVVELNQLLSFYVYDPAKSVNQSRGFGIQYKDYEYFKTRGYHVYDVVLDLPFFELLDFLRISFVSKNKIEGDIEEVYLRINEKKQVASLLLYGKDTDIQDYERIDFIPTLLKDLGDESRNLPQFSTSQNKARKDLPETKQVVEKPEFLTFVDKLNSETPNIHQQVISICRDIVGMSDQTAEKINQLKDLLN